MMDFKIIKESTNEIEFEIENESHGVCNALRHILMRNDDVEFAVYNIDHPLTGKPIMTIKTSHGSPREALREASEELKSDSEAFKQLIEDNL